MSGAERVGASRDTSTFCVPFGWSLEGLENLTNDVLWPVEKGVVADTIFENRDGEKVTTWATGGWKLFP